MIAPNVRQDRRRPDHIAGRAKLDDQYILFKRLIIRASIAPHPLALVRHARDIAAKVAAVWVVDDVVVLGHSFGRQLLGNPPPPFGHLPLFEGEAHPIMSG
jgi:hypothetical protein